MTSIGKKDGKVGMIVGSGSNKQQCCDIGNMTAK